VLRARHPLERATPAFRESISAWLKSSGEFLALRRWRRLQARAGSHLRTDRFDIHALRIDLRRRRRESNFEPATEGCLEYALE
jgi:hypothetical protein